MGEMLTYTITFDEDKVLKEEIDGRTYFLYIFNGLEEMSDLPYVKYTTDTTLTTDDIADLFQCTKGIKYVTGTFKIF